jgi:hypothetical protein
MRSRSQAACSAGMSVRRLMDKIRGTILGSSVMVA